MNKSDLGARPLSEVKESFNVRVSDIANILDAADKAEWFAGSKMDSYKEDRDMPEEVFAGPTEMTPQDVYNRISRMKNAEGHFYERQQDGYELHGAVLSTGEGEQPFLLPAHEIGYESMDFEFLSENEARVTVEVDSYSGEFYEVYHVSGESLAEDLGVNASEYLD
ncbi:MAG: hypothetical protein ACI8Z7_000300 [Candidatus Nanohaloarchaea archaeon]|jgi:hypothetical protein